MSSTRIPLLSGDLPFFEFVDCSLQLFCRDLWDSCHLIGAVVVHISAALFSSSPNSCSGPSCSLSSYIFCRILQRHLQFLLEMCCILLSHVFFVMSALFFAGLIPGICRTPLKSSRILWMSICLFILFLSLMHLFMHLLTSFSLCFSPLGVLLLSSMSLRISASLTEMSSLTFAAADAVARDSLLSFLISLVLLLE